MNLPQVLLLHEHAFGGEINESIVDGFEANGFEVTCLRKGMSWEPHFDIVIAYGPFEFESGHLLTVSKQILSLSPHERPLFVWWLTENPPPQWIPPKFASAAAKLRLWSDEYIAKIPASRLRNNLLRAHRLRVLGQVQWAWKQGCLDILVVTNRARAQYFQAHGFAPVVAPLGYHREYGTDLGLERDIDVAFLGQTNSKRRRRILPGVFSDLRARGISVEVANNLYGADRTNFLNRSKILLNILRSPQDFVGQRLILAAANRALTISEPMFDPYPFKAGKHLQVVSLHDLADAVEHALRDDVTRHRIVDEAYQFVTQELTCEKMVRRIVVRAQEIRKNIVCEFN